MNKKNANNSGNNRRTNSEQVIDDTFSPGIPPCFINLLAELQTGLAIGLLGKPPSDDEINRPGCEAGRRAGLILLKWAENDPTGPAALWRDIARHGETSGRYGPGEDCRPTILGQEPDVLIFLQQLWDAGQQLGAMARHECAKQFDYMGTVNIPNFAHPKA